MLNPNRDLAAGAGQRLTISFNLSPVTQALRAGLLSLGVVMACVPVTAAQAQEQAAAQQGYSIPAGPLGQQLNQFASQAGITLSFEPGLVAGKQGPALSGSYTPMQGLQAVLAGSGLEAFPQGVGYGLRVAPEVGQGTPAQLAPMTVTADRSDLPGELPKVYAGGQVARGGRVGMLGNKDFMDTPFSQTNYTQEAIQNIQAVTLSEVLEYNPSITRLSGRYYSNDGYKIRGFDVFSWDSAYDGLFNLGSVRRVGIESLERVELLKGPNALLYGVPPGGAVGGMVNLVPKRATDEPITRATLSHLADSNVGAHVDVGRRLGEFKEFGVRVNLAQRQGDTNMQFNRDDSSLGSLSLDYQGEKLRLFGNFNYQQQEQDAAVFTGYAPVAGLAIPKAPDASTNPVPPFTFTDTDRDFHVLRAEYDLTENWTLGAAYGRQTYDEHNLNAFTRSILNTQGDSGEPGTYREIFSAQNNESMEINLNGRIDTGPISHQIAISQYSSVRDAQTRLRSVAGGGAVSNVYNLQHNYSAPDFTGVPFSLSHTEVTTGGFALADTLGFFDDQLQLTLGLRKQNIRNKNLAAGITAYDESATTPTIAVLYRFTDRLSVYGNYIEGLAQAPTPPVSAVNFDEVFEPAVTEQREVGLKYDTGRFATTVSLFEISRPSGVLDANTNVFSLSGEQRHRGIEIEGFGEVADDIRLMGGVTYMDAKLVRTQGGVNEGNRPTDVPEWVTTVRGEWDVNLIPGFTLIAGAVHNSSRYYDATNTQEIPGWTRVDLGARYGTKLGARDVTLRANLVNALNKNYWESTSFSLVTGAPRTLSVSATVDF